MATDDRNELFFQCALADDHLTDWDRTFLASVRAKLDAGEELSERDARTLDHFRRAIVHLDGCLAQSTESKE